MRTCDRCNAEMNVGRPRVRVNKQMWCQTCVKDTSAPSGRYKPGTDIKTAHLDPADLIGLQNSREFVRADMKGVVPADSRSHPKGITHLRTDHRYKDADDLHSKSAAEIEELHRRAHAFEDSQRGTPMEKYMPPMHDHTMREFDPHRDAPHYTLSSLEHPVPVIAMNASNDDGSEFAHVRMSPVEALKAGNALVQQAAKVLGLRKQAHDSGDGQTIYHCPFCGSGQVIARSDKTIECEFCHTSFTVQVQPEYSAFPQTMDGQPVQVPGMPGQIDAPVGGSDQDPAVDPMAGGDPMLDQDGDGGFAPGDPASVDNQPPWLTAGLKTQAGKVLPVEEYVHHLAIKHAGERRQDVLRTVKASREFS